MTALTTRKAISEWAAEMEIDIFFYDPADIFDPAIVGVARRFNDWFIVYDMGKVLANFADEMRPDDDDPDGVEATPMSDAIEHFNYNVVGAWFGEPTAAFLITEGGE